MNADERQMMTDQLENEVDQDPRWGLVEEGLLSPLLERWRLIYLENQPDWFSLARDLNRCAFALYQRHLDAGNGEASRAQMPTAVRIYARALNAYAASIILAERALAIEAAGTTRAIYESGFWLSLLASDPVKALDELQIDEDSQAIQRERLLRERCPEDAALIAASKAREAERQNRLGKKRPMSVKVIAETMPEQSGYLEYRLVSNFYGHLSNGSLDGLKRNVGERAVINILGPHESEIPKALFFAIDAMTRTGGYFAVMRKDEEVIAELRSARARMLKLIDAGRAGTN